MSNISTQRVLVVDDHDFVRNSISLILKQLKVQSIETARNGIEAANLLSGSDGSEFDLILCDLNMPGEDGLSLLRKLSELNYDGAIVLMTGEGGKILKSAEVLASRFGHRVIGVIEKPVTSKQCQTFLFQAQKNRKKMPLQDVVLLGQDEIKQAIEERWLSVFFQPQVDITSRKVCGFEALVRIQHPKYGLLAPDSFIAAAEAGKHIHPLTDFVIREALSWTRRFHDAGYATSISINLASKILEDQSFPQRLLDLTREMRLSPEMIVCELTETMLAKDTTLVLETMTRLLLHKFRLSIDDFGTGFASLEQLHVFPFHELKVDRCFVQDFSVNEKSRSILENSLHLADDLNLSTVAEGVETEACLTQLKTLGCNTAQGYHISRPMPATDVCNWLGEWQSY